MGAAELPFQLRHQTNERAGGRFQHFNALKRRSAQVLCRLRAAKAHWDNGFAVFSGHKTYLNSSGDGSGNPAQSAKIET